MCICGSGCVLSGLAGHVIYQLIVGSEITGQGHTREICHVPQVHQPFDMSENMLGMNHYYYIYMFTPNNTHLTNIYIYDL